MYELDAVVGREAPETGGNVVVDRGRESFGVDGEDLWSFRKSPLRLR
jgi:hypothetical protein